MLYTCGKARRPPRLQSCSIKVERCPVGHDGLAAFGSSPAMGGKLVCRVVMILKG